MKWSRQLHLWIGLICTLFILIEAVTGFFMLEPGLLGGTGGPPMQAARHAATDGNASSAVSDGTTNAAADGQRMQTQAPEGRRPEDKEGGGGAMGFIKNLHKGKIGSADITLLLDITAVGMVVLCITGILLSIRVLGAQRRSRLKKKAAAQTAQP